MEVKTETRSFSFASFDDYFSGTEAGAGFSERVLFAARLDAEGFRDDATIAWRALSRERPDDEVLRKLAGDTR